MEERIDIGRREFNATAILAMLSGVAITVAGCGGGSSSPTMPTSTTGTGTGTTTGTTTTDKTGAISNNHGHAATVTSVQLTSGGVALNIQGTASHPHTVNLSGAQLTAIAGGQRVSTESTSDAGHSHTVTFN